MNNPQAFPQSFESLKPDVEGMTLLDYFAGQALNNEWRKGYYPKDYAKDAYELAEAMLKEREKHL